VLAYVSRLWEPTVPALTAIRGVFMIIPIRTSLRALLAVIAIGAVMAVVAAAAEARIQLGAYTPGAPASAEALNEYTEMVGRKPEIVMWYRDFSQPLLYSNEIANLRASGQTPMVTWEPYEQSLAAIASGADDSYLHESAQIAKGWGSTLMIRFGHEMNGSWYPWAGSNASPEAFIAAWRHIVSLFRADGANNVKWVWSPNVQEGRKDPISPYFPGEAWIDYVGLDGYNWGSAEGRWQSLGEVFASSYAVVTQFSSKPVIITETSSSETGGDKAAWIRSGFISELPQSFPRVSAVIWFNKSQQEDWRINSSQASLEAYRAVASCSTYGGNLPCETSAGSAERTESTASRKHPEKLAVRSLHVTKLVSKVASGTVSYGLSQSAEVQIKIEPRGHSTRRVALSKRSQRGHNRVSLARVVRRHKLRVGSYRVIISAHGDEGQRSRPDKAQFRVV
jgi:hypothetical protein